MFLKYYCIILYYYIIVLLYNFKIYNLEICNHEIINSNFKPKWLFSTLKGCIVKPLKPIEPPGFDLSDLIRSSESSGKDCYMDPWLKSQTPWRFLRGLPEGLLRLLLPFIEDMKHYLVAHPTEKWWSSSVGMMTL